MKFSKDLLRKKTISKAFTLVEIMIVTVILGLVLSVIFSIYFQMQKMKTDIFAKSMLIKNTNALVEKLNIIMKNYTIDYEEYFDRRIVGCDGNNGGDNFTWNVGKDGHCDDFTAYGNENSVDSNTGNNVLYYCMSGTTSNLPKETPGSANDCEGNTAGVTGSNYIYANSDLDNGSGCWASVGAGKRQSFGEYKYQFWDVKGNADSYMGCKGDDDDTDLGLGPVAIGDNLHVKELYLISKDKKKRIFIRRSYVTSGDFNDDGIAGDVSGEVLYKLQILKLRGFDIGSGHDADKYGPTYNDGKIDTWACDKQEGFVCHGPAINGGYVGYNLPKDINDGWLNFTVNDITIEDFNISIFPTIDPNLAWQDTGVQIYPYLRIKLKTGFYPTNYRTKLNPKELLKYKMSLQTTFSIKPY